MFTTTFNISPCTRIMTSLSESIVNKILAEEDSDDDYKTVSLPIETNEGTKSTIIDKVNYKYFASYQWKLDPSNNVFRQVKKRKVYLANEIMMMEDIRRIRRAFNEENMKKEALEKIAQQVENK